LEGIAPPDPQLGLRHDYQPWGTERNHGTSNFDPFAKNPLNNLTGRIEYAGVDYGDTPLQERPHKLRTPRRFCARRVWQQ
jgi:hypothetical protein